MRHVINAVMFIARLISGRCGKTVSHNIMLGVAGGIIPAIVYLPANAVKIRGTVISIAGLSVHGTDDPRIILLNRAVALSGFAVVSPVIQEINSFKITAESIDHIADIALAVIQQKSLCPSGTVSFIAPSFSGGICLAAAAKRAIARRINAVCTIGTFSDVRKVLRYLMESRESDEYGRLIILKNFVHYAVGVRPELERALELAYLDNGYQREVRELDSWLIRMSSENRRLFLKLRDDREFRIAIWEKAEAVMRHELNIFEEMDIAGYAADISGHCVLIHGECDNVIPPAESAMMHEALLRAGGKSTLAVTPLVTHGDTKYTVSMLPKLVTLISAFGAFFKSASSQSGPPGNNTWTETALGLNDIINV